MSKSFSLRQLTEGIRDRNLAADHGRLVSKWTRTGLLRGLNEQKRETMSRLLENQAAQVLREANTLGTSAGAAGNIDGFSNIAFPIVRRVFGGLVANELVSIQPMSLPSGLLFYLDYSYGSQIGGEDSGAAGGLGNLALSGNAAATYEKGDSLYGSPSGNSIQQGANAIGGMYDLAGSTYSKAHVTGSSVAAAGAATGLFSPAGAASTSGGGFTAAGVFDVTANLEATSVKNLKLLQYDPQIVKDIVEDSTAYQFMCVDISNLTAFDKTLAKGVSLTAYDGASSQDGLSAVPATIQQGTNIFNVRRLNQIGLWNATSKTWTPKATSDSTATDLLMIVKGTVGSTGNLDTVFGAAGHVEADGLKLVYPKADSVTSEGGTGGVVTIPSFESGFSGDASGNVAPIIPEIDIKIESIAVTAQTRKLRARWSPELAQDLNAYHSMDAEVELTQILSEQIALEIDREILNDLLVEAQAANYYWSRAPGKFVKKDTAAVSSSTIGPAFHGTVREWYETLVETIIDVANEIHRKTLRGAANFIVVSPEVATIFESSILYKPSLKIDGQGQVGVPFSIGAESIGSLSNRFTVYKDPYFPRNKILVGYKGGSYLESGYVYAPYVPLIVTPTIFAPEDFTPRKGVMTRYGKKMVRADFYGTVTVLDMDII
jgi:hypothetical protein